MYYPGLDGDAKESQILTYDFMHVMDIYNSQIRTNNAYISLNADYEFSRNKYEEAIAKEKKQLLDLFEQFQPKVEVP